MEHRPAGFDDDDVRAALRRHHGIDAHELHYRAVGFGDYHWHVAGADGRSWFVKISDLADKPQCGADPGTALAGYRATLRAAAELRRAGLEFVLAPEPAPGGDLAVDLDGRWALTVFRHVEARTFDFFSPLSAHERDDVLVLLARLHAVDPPAGTPPQVPVVPDRAVIDRALGDLGTPWEGGQYSEPAREAVATHAGAVRARLAEADRLVERVRDAARPPVVTHGEPHPGNLLQTADGFLLIDWDTAGLAVPERDLAVLESGPDDLAGYAALSGHEPDPVALELYRLSWGLADLGEFLRWFRAPHADDGDALTAWDGLVQTLTGLAGHGGHASGSP